MHPLHCTFPVPYMSFGLQTVLLSQIGVCASSPQEFYSPVSIRHDLLFNPVFDGVGRAGFKSKANAILLS